LTLFPPSLGTAKHHHRMN